MSSHKQVSKKSVIKIFTGKKVLTLNEASKILNRSEYSTKYHIKKCGAITSFNKNAKYYSLPSIIDFDENGFWEYENICFSKYGTVQASTTALIENSSSGLSGDEIGRLLKCPPYPLLARLTKMNTLRREKILGRYIYFSIDDEVFEQQHKKYLNKCGTDTESFNLVYILALVERINNPNISIQEISGRLRRKNVSATSDFIKKMFTQSKIIEEQSAFSSVRLLREALDKTQKDLSPHILFSKVPVVPFDASKSVDQCCGKDLKKYKTKTKTVFTMHIGEFYSYEKMVKCAVCDAKYHSAELLELVPSGSSYGYDVMIFIGESMFSRHRQAVEIQAELRERNIPVSVSEIEYLAKRFIIYLTIVHEQNNTGIVEMMNANGGYILHIDALGDKGGQRLISAVDSISDFVLGNAKIRSEDSDYVGAFLEKIKKQFGDPLAVVQDMGKGIMKAVKTVFPEIKILICHFHFLRDIGKDLLEESYDIIRKRLRHFGFLTKLRAFSKDLKYLFEKNGNEIDIFFEARNQKHKINLNNNTETAIFLYTLVEWILDWKNESNGYGFPFDRPHFDLALRVMSAFKILDSIKDEGKKTEISVVKISRRLKALLKEISEDSELKINMNEIENEFRLFDGLRNAMRIAPKNGVDGLNDDGEDANIKTIEASVDKLIAKLKEKPEFKKKKKGVAFMKQIDKYRKQLFADPITVKTFEGTQVIQPQRTNNIMERMFRDFTRDNKRKTGSDSAGRTIQGMIDDTLLIRNLKNENYKKIIIGDKKNLAEVFSKIDVNTVREKMKEYNVCNEKIPEKIQKLLKEENLTDILSNIGSEFSSNQKI
ncbi:MAG: transposase [Bacteroidota bacterium]|nr:transposase [Bacteroidota bacterium]